MKTYKGTAASEGIVAGRIMLYGESGIQVNCRTVDDTEAEIARFEQAKENAKREIAEIYERALRELGEAGAAIFEVHQMLLDDLNFTDAVTERIEQEKVNAECAVKATCGQFTAMFEAMDNEYMRARAADVKDIGDRVLAKLRETAPAVSCEENTESGSVGTKDMSADGRARTAEAAGKVRRGQRAPDEKKAAEPVILAAEELTPSELMRLGKSGILALVTRRGSVNSHTSILARTMGIPALTGVEFGGGSEMDEHAELHGRAESCERNRIDGQAKVSEKDRVDGHPGIVDAYAGLLLVDPDEAALEEYRAKQNKEAERAGFLSELRNRETITRDGRRIRLNANIGCVEDAEEALRNGAEGIGLFRSEFLYLKADDFPDEEEQFAAYRAVAEKMAGREVVIRTADFGTDKGAEYLHLPHEANPALGYRGIRICLDRTDVFRTQLRAILRAACYGKLAVMYPMIISVDEVRRAKQILEEARAELEEQNIPHGEVEQGIMVETPAAVWLSEELAREVDFFSIGTNDLTQYMLAVDRQNPRLDAFCDPRHPAVLGAVRTVVENAHRHGIRAAICGELAADAALAEEFLRMGVDELSVSPARILPVRAAVRAI